MTPQTQQLLIELYERTCRWQRRQGITVELTQDEFNALWSKYRLNKLDRLTAGDPRQLRAYLRNPTTKPVCGWRRAEDREVGVLNKDTARIMMAEEQRRLFQFRKGDRHSPETIIKMSKPKPAKTREKMAAAARKRWAAYRADKEKNDD